MATPSFSLFLNCDFVFIHWKHSGMQYTCNGKNLEVLDPNLRFLSMEGTHLYNKSNSDVLGIVLEHQMMIYLVQGATAFFSKLEDYSVAYTNLSYVQRNDFKHMKNIKTLALANNRIQRIPQDTFEDLVRLEYLTLSHNEIKSLPTNMFRPLINLKGLYLNGNQLQELSHNLFKFNQKLADVWLQNNKLELIGSNVTHPISSLKHVLLHGNVCIDKDYNDITESIFKELLHDVRANCSSACEQKMIEVAECHEKYFELEQENENLKKEISRMRNYLRSYLIV